MVQAVLVYNVQTVMDSYAYAYDCMLLVTLCR